MDDFARCIKEDKSTRVPAEMGLRDMEIIAAVYESAKTNLRATSLVSQSSRHGDLFFTASRSRVLNSSA